MSEEDEDIQTMTERLTRVPQASALGFRVLSTEPGYVRVFAPWHADLVGDPDTDVLAGGVVTTLLDHACGMAVSAARIGQRGSPTLDLRIDYMRAAGARSGVTAAAHCYKLTRSIAFVRAVAWDVEEADPIATAQAAFALHDGAPR